MGLVFLILVGLILYFVLAHTGKIGGRGAAGPETALDILKKRYARGEISKEEFDRLKNDILQ